MSDSDESLRTRLLVALGKSDVLRREGRADRIVWLRQHQIEGGLHVGLMDTMTVLGEAPACFIEGHYVAVLMLAVAFIEHTLMDELKARGFDGKVRNLGAAIERAEEMNVFPADLLTRATALRKIRNPFAHLDADDEYSFGNRYIERRVHPETILEQDAKDALEVMYAMFRLTLGN